MIQRTSETQNNLKDVAMACQSEGADNFNGTAMDVLDCFDPSQTGLGLYLPAGSQTPTPPSLSTSLPNTPGSWTSQVAVSVEAPHLGDPKSDNWNRNFEDFTQFTDAPIGWNETNSFASHEENEVHRCFQGPPFQETTSHTSALLLSQRTSISSGYPNTSECYRPDSHGSTLYHTTKIEQDDYWFDNFDKFDISSSVDTAQEEVLSVPPVDPSLLNPYRFESNQFCQFASTLTSPNTHQSNDLSSSGRAIRMNSLPGQVHEDLYEKAIKSVARIRKRRRMSTPSRANYICHICGRPFSRNYNLQIHLPTHTPDRPKQWSCTWTGCDKIFTRRTDLVRHEKCVHTRDKDHYCVACGFSSSRKDTLRRHVEDGCQKRKIQGKKISNKDHSSVVKLRAKPPPSSSAVSVLSAFAPMDRTLHSSNMRVIHHGSINDIAQGLG